MTEFFSYYEKGKYDSMKQYCSDEFISNFFHDGDVFGNTTAKLIEIQGVTYGKIHSSIL